jgi:hypothetical protein
MAISRRAIGSPELPVHLVDTGSIIEPISGRLELHGGDLRAVAVFLGLISLDSFLMDYSIEPLEHGRFKLTGKLHAELSQACVITLEPVPEIVDEPIETALWPDSQMRDEELSPPEDDDVEPAPLEEPPVRIIGGRADLAGFAIEILSTSMEAYPRKTDAKFDWQDPLSGPDGRALSPFADLEKKFKSGK